VEKYGIKVSIKDRDVKTAADHELLFSSGWPTLKIHTSGTFTIAAGPQSATAIWTSDLSFEPVYWVFSNLADVGTITSTQAVMNVDNVSFQGGKLYYRETLLGEGPVSGRFYIFEYDLTTGYTASLLRAQGISDETDKGLGFKVSKPGTNITTSDFRNYALNSSARTLSIHKTGYGTEDSSSSFSQTIAHGLPYAPFTQVFMHSTGLGFDGWFNVGDFNQNQFMQVNGTNIEFGAVGGIDKWFYIAYKDPYDLEE
jgi:hypothetical protein